MAQRVTVSDLDAWDMDMALHRQRHAIDRMSDQRAGQLVRHMQAFYLGHKNGYEPGGPKHDPRLWAQVYKNAGEQRDPSSSRARTKPKRRHR